MAYKKYIKKGDKLYGPYLYENKRVGNRVVTTYAGKHAPSSKRSALWLTFVVAAFALLLFGGYVGYQGFLTGKAVGGGGGGTENEQDGGGSDGSVSGGGGRSAQAVEQAGRAFGSIEISIDGAETAREELISGIDTLGPNEIELVLIDVQDSYAEALRKLEQIRIASEINPYSDAILEQLTMAEIAVTRLEDIEIELLTLFKEKTREKKQFDSDVAQKTLNRIEHRSDLVGGERDLVNVIEPSSLAFEKNEFLSIDEQLMLFEAPLFEDFVSVTYEQKVAYATDASGFVKWVVEIIVSEDFPDNQRGSFSIQLVHDNPLNLELVRSGSALIQNGYIQDTPPPRGIFDFVLDFFDESRKTFVPEIAFRNVRAGERYTLSYLTEAPKTTIVSTSTDKTIVTVTSLDDLHYEHVIAEIPFSELPNLPQDEHSYSVWWMEESKFIEDINVYQNADEERILQWIVPHTSNQTFEIIVITDAQHLNSDREFVSTIYEEVFQLDDVWSETIPSGDYVRVSFEKNLTSENDITIYPRFISGTPRIDIYEKDGLEIIASFDDIEENSYNKVFLEKLQGIQDVFDLLISDGSVQFDHIVDPEFEQVTACQDLSESGTTYVLVVDISSIDTCFTVTANDIVFEGNGHTIFGTGEDGSVGIDAINRLNVTVRNVTISDFDVGVRVANTHHSLFEHIITNASRSSGFRVSSGGNTLIRSFTSLNDYVGFGFLSSWNYRLIDSVIRDSVVRGIEITGSARNSSVENTFIDTVGEDAIFLTNVVNKFPRDNVFINTHVTGTSSPYSDIHFDAGGIHGTSFINTFLGRYAFVGEGGTIRYQTDNGNIVFFNNIAGTGLNLSDDIQIRHNLAVVKPENNPFLSGPANVTLFNLIEFFEDPVILRNGFNCAHSCTNFTSLQQSTVSFNVTGWSNYSIGEFNSVPSAIVSQQTVGEESVDDTSSDELEKERVSSGTAVSSSLTREDLDNLLDADTFFKELNNFLDSDLSEQTGECALECTVVGTCKPASTFTRVAFSSDISYTDLGVQLEVCNVVCPNQAASSFSTERFVSCVHDDSTVDIAPGDSDDSVTLVVVSADGDSSRSSIVIDAIEEEVSISFSQSPPVPDHCYNLALDSDFGEELIDCGGTCRACSFVNEQPFPVLWWGFFVALLVVLLYLQNNLYFVAQRQIHFGMRSLEKKQYQDALSRYVRLKTVFNSLHLSRQSHIRPKALAFHAALQKVLGTRAVSSQISHARGLPAMKHSSHLNATDGSDRGRVNKLIHDGFVFIDEGRATPAHANYLLARQLYERLSSRDKRAVRRPLTRYFHAVKKELFRKRTIFRVEGRFPSNIIVGRKSRKR